MLFGPGCPLSDPCLSPGQAGGARTVNALSGDPPDIQLQSPDKIFGLVGDDDEDGFLTDLLAILDEATAEPHAAASPLEASMQAVEKGPEHQPPPAVTQVKKRLAEQQRAEREAAVAAERDAAAKLRHFRSWTQPDDVSKNGKKRSRDMVAVGKLQDVRDAGIFKPAELDELQNELAQQAKPEVSGAARHVLQLQLHRQKRTLAVAEEWFTAHDSLMQQDAEDDDMP
eukprot:gene3338-3614_t